MFITALKRKENGWIRAQIKWGYMEMVSVSPPARPPASLFRNSSSIIKMNKELFTPKWKANSHELPRFIAQMVRRIYGKTMPGYLYVWEQWLHLKRNTSRTQGEHANYLFEKFAMAMKSHRENGKRKQINVFTVVYRWDFFSGYFMCMQCCQLATPVYASVVLMISRIFINNFQIEESRS